MGDVGPVVLGDRYAQLAGAQAWAAFLFASHLFGDLVFLLGSWLDEFYDWVTLMGSGLAFLREQFRGARNANRNGVGVKFLEIEIRSDAI
jgi:hypothetical protein